MKKKVLSAVIALSLALSFNFGVMASPSNGQADKTSDLERQIESMDSSIETLMHKISTNKDDIANSKKELEKLSKDIEKCKKDIASKTEVFNKRVRAVYISGLDSYASIILESKGLSDLVERIDSVSKVMNFDKKVMTELKNKQEEMKTKQVAANEKNKKMIALKAENEKKLASMENEKAKVQAQVKDLEKKQEEQRQVAQASTSSSSSSSSKSSSSRRMSRGSSSIVPSSKNGGSVVGYAQSFLGVPYVWGGTSPSGFDCSGFVQYVYAHFGVGLPRVASAQQGVGTSVPKSQLQPGDLVFFNSPASHVGIYVGGGQYIHAPRTGDVVKISPLGYRSDYSGAKRVR
ncbi:NlpC/P60 family protein [Clostridium oceanicum]|uniref:C40 family peptidase n=1 Tax=Clostridium oceanicum TaxID=1543 RepID=A0ABN1JEM1_9CLOT